MIESKHPNQERAIAAALEASEPGDVVEIHADDCGTIELDVCASCGGSGVSHFTEVCDDCRCTCTPIVITVGPKA